MTLIFQNLLYKKATKNKTKETLKIASKIHRKVFIAPLETPKKPIQLAKSLLWRNTKNEIFDFSNFLISSSYIFDVGFKILVPFSI